MLYYTFKNQVKGEKMKNLTLSYDGYNLEDLENNNYIEYKFVNYGYIENNYNELIIYHYSLDTKEFCFETKYHKNNFLFKRCLKTYLGLKEDEKKEVKRQINDIKSILEEGEMVLKKCLKEKKQIENFIYLDLKYISKHNVNELLKNSLKKLNLQIDSLKESIKEYKRNIRILKKHYEIKGA